MAGYVLQGELLLETEGEERQFLHANDSLLRPRQPPRARLLRPPRRPRPPADHLLAATVLR